MHAPADRLNDPDHLEQQFADRFNAAWRSSVLGIIEAGRVLGEARDKLPRGRFESWVEERLHRTRQTAYQLIAIADDERIVKHVLQMPTSWGTLYKISRLDDEEFNRLLNNGTIHAEMQRRDLGPTKPRPPKPTPVIIPGHLADRMKIIQGDCRNVLPTIREPHLLVCDPPYNQGYHYDGYDDCLPPDEYRNMLISVFGGKPCVIILYPEEIINLLGGGALGECLEVVSWVYPSNTAKQHRLVTWWNCRPDLSRLGQPYKNPTDKRIVKLIDEGLEARLYDWWGDIHQVKNVSKDHDHPCPVPVELARRIILTTTEPGDLIVDPFAGSFTIPAVAAALGRYGAGIEQSERYCQIGEARLGTIEEELGLKDEAVYAEAAE